MNKENIKPGDILSTEDGKIAHVRKLTKHGVTVYINHERDIILDEQLHHWKLANPIIDNRLVSSYTFAVRFKQFLDWIPKNWVLSQPHYYEEYEYMKNVADRLIKYQIETVTNENEINYLKRLELL